MPKPTFTFDEVLKRARDFTAIIPQLTERKLNEMYLAIGKEKHRRLISQEEDRIEQATEVRVYVPDEE